MIRNSAQKCTYYTTEKDGYGSDQLVLEPAGTITMSVHLTSYSTQQNILFAGSGYLGLTHEKVNQNWLIDAGLDYLLQITYIIEKGRYIQVFMKTSSHPAPQERT